MMPAESYSTAIGAGATATNVSFKQIYEKYRSGDPLTDQEVIAGQKHFAELARQLYALDDTFRLAASECRRIADALDSFMRARRLDAYKKG